MLMPTRAGLTIVPMVPYHGGPVEGPPAVDENVCIGHPVMFMFC